MKRLYQHRVIFLALVVMLSGLGAWSVSDRFHAPRGGAGEKAIAVVLPESASRNPTLSLAGGISEDTGGGQPGASRQGRDASTDVPHAAQPASSPAVTEVLEPSVGGAGRSPALAASSASGSDQLGTGNAATLADLLAEGVDLSDPGQRARVVERLRELETAQKAEAGAFAEKEGLPVRVEQPDGTVRELARLKDGRPLYRVTHNAKAAISTGADRVRQAPYNSIGSGVTIGLWDGGSARTTHQELTGRVTNVDGASTDDHATHVAGTLAASGVVATAQGMAPAATIASYDWNNDLSEMTARGAAYPGEAGKILFSNHSYGYGSGWGSTGLSTPKWIWYGNGTSATSIDRDFGAYSSESRDNDALVASLPYYLIFRAAGNERADNPSQGDSVSLSTSTSASRAVSYDSSQHPGGDGTYRQGYDSISYDALAKNIVTVGAVNDAVSGSSRAPANGTMLSFSSWGPADDGRIKPDLVANGYELYSSIATNNTAYASYSGTSMATPNAAGSAALLAGLYGQLFPGQALRASTLKGLLIHTADDLGTTGPDYQYGWGLVNARAAAELIQSYHDHSGLSRMTEDRLTTASVTRTYAFEWDGVSPIRATLCWTDPAGTSATTSDSRTPRLVNNLDLALTDPEGGTHLPYVMPYVGSWAASTLSAPATTGKNNVDNIEQIYLDSPSLAGIYTATVTVDGALSGGSQVFSLVLSGGVEQVAPVPPEVRAVTPDSGISGTATLTLSGSGFRLGATVSFLKRDEPEVSASGVEVFGDSIKCRVDLDNMDSGVWDIQVTNPGDAIATLAGGFFVQGPLWHETFEEDAAGWTSMSSAGSGDFWELTTARSHSSSHAYQATLLNASHVADLETPAIPIPEETSDLTLSFWHAYRLSTNRAGGVLEISNDEGESWADVTFDGTNLEFATGGYNATLNAGSSGAANPLAGRRGWAGNVSGFTQAVLNFTDVSRYAGHTVRLRWRLVSGRSTSGAGGNSGYWAVDDIVLSGIVVSQNHPPSITAAATAAPSTVAGTTTELTVEAEDADDAGDLIYTWSSTGDFRTPVQFSDNGSASAHHTTATFPKAGTYTLTVTVRDPDNLSVSSSTDVTVLQTPADLEVSPALTYLSRGGRQQFAAEVADQFGDIIDLGARSLAVTWTAEGGAIDASGLFVADDTVGTPFVVRAEASGLVASVSGVIAGPTLEEWRATFLESVEAEEAGNLGDPDGDGLTNLLEYALGQNPLAWESPPAPVVEDGVLSLTYQRPAYLPGLAYIVEITSDLVTWTEVPSEVISEGEIEILHARFEPPLSEDDESAYFMRLRVAEVE